MKFEDEYSETDGVFFRPTVVPVEERGPLPKGLAEIKVVRLLRQNFGGEDWRKCSEGTRQSGEYEFLTYVSWRNEYGVRVEVLT